MSNSYRDLDAWKQAMDLAAEIIRLCSAMSVHAQATLGRQLVRSAISIPSNIAEGWGRGDTQANLNHCRIARGSVCELQTQLELAIRTELIAKETGKTLMESTESVSRLTNGLVRHLEAKRR